MNNNLEKGILYRTGRQLGKTRTIGKVLRGEEVKITKMDLNEEGQKRKTTEVIVRRLLEQVKKTREEKGEMFIYI